MLLRRIFPLNSGPEVLMLDLPNTMLLGDLGFPMSPPTLR